MAGKAVREGNVVVLHRTDGKTVDVFTGQGWDKHTVFEVNEGKVRLIRGASVTNEEFRKFKESL